MFKGGSVIVDSAADYQWHGCAVTSASQERVGFVHLLNNQRLCVTLFCVSINVYYLENAGRTLGLLPVGCLKAAQKAPSM